MNESILPPRGARKRQSEKESPRKKNSWFRENKDLISACTTIAQVFFTLALVGVTMIYAGETRRMVNLMQKDFELNNRPYLFNNPSFELIDDGVIITNRIYNVGRLPAQITGIVVNNEKIPAFKTCYPNHDVEVQVTSNQNYSNGDHLSIEVEYGPFYEGRSYDRLDYVFSDGKFEIYESHGGE